MSYDGPGMYRHYKGGLYDVIGLGLDEGDRETLAVLYKPLAGWPSGLPKADYWVRPLDVFNEVLTGLGAEPVPRFAKIAGE